MRYPQEIELARLGARTLLERQVDEFLGREDHGDSVVRLKLMRHL